MDDETAIRTVIHDRATAMRTGDAATICATYAPEAVVVQPRTAAGTAADGARDVAKMRGLVRREGRRGVVRFPRSAHHRRR